MRHLADERQSDRDIETKPAEIVDEFARVRFRREYARKRDRTKPPTYDRHLDVIANGFDAQQDLEGSKAFGDDIAVFARQMRREPPPSKIPRPGFPSGAPVDADGYRNVASGWRKSECQTDASRERIARYIDVGFSRPDRDAVIVVKGTQRTRQRAIKLGSACVFKENSRPAR